MQRVCRADALGKVGDALHQHAVEPECLGHQEQQEHDGPAELRIRTPTIGSKQAQSVNQR